MTYGSGKELSVFSDAYQKLYPKLKWQGAEMVAYLPLFYLVTGKDLNTDELISVAESLKQGSSMFSSFRTFQRFIAAASLCSRFNDPLAKIELAKASRSALYEAGFKKGAYTDIASMALLDKDTWDRIPARAMKLFRLMKQEHPFLTTPDDYPMAVALAGMPGAPEQISGVVEQYYQGLKETKFSVSNELQLLAQMLTLLTGDYKRSFSGECINFKEKLTAHKVKLWNMQIPFLSFLVTSGINPDAAGPEIKRTAAELKKLKGLRCSKGARLTVALWITAVSLQERGVFGEYADAALQTLVYAQQAAVTAAVASSSAAVV